MKNMNNPKEKARDKAWEHVTQRLDENGKKVLVCNFCHVIMRGGGIHRVKKHLAGRIGEVAPCTLVDPDVRLTIQATLKEPDHKPPKENISDDETVLNKVNELRAIVAEEVTRAIQAAMPGILEQNTEMTRKMIEERIGVDKEEKQANEDVVVVEKEDFSDCMPEFTGVCEPVTSLRWILELENIFKAIKCDDGDKVVYAVSKLRLEAKSWWEIVKDKCGPTMMTWSRFKEVFKEKFCPISVVMQQEEEFLTFKQGSRLVKEYTAHFVEMARFVEHLVATEERKIERYLQGLRMDIKELISRRNLLTFWEVVEGAQDIENIITRGFGENDDIKRRQGRSGENLNNENKKAGKRVSFSDRHDLFLFDLS